MGKSKKRKFELKSLSYYPKTGNTYSRMYHCTYELAPGVSPMPNMSRRSLIQPKPSYASTMWFSDVDSDSEHYESTARHTRQIGFFRRITSTISRTVRITVSTFLAIIWLLYAHTVGAVFRAVTQDAAAGTEIPKLLYPVLWFVNLSRQLMVLEVYLLSLLAAGNRRNWLLGLLLLLLLGVPIYILYAGGYEFIVIQSYLSELKANLVIPPYLSKLAQKLPSI